MTMKKTALLLGVVFVALSLLVGVAEGQRAIFSLGKRVKKRFGQKSAKLIGEGYEDEEGEDQKRQRQQKADWFVWGALGATIVSGAVAGILVPYLLNVWQQQLNELDRPEEDGEFGFRWRPRRVCVDPGGGLRC